MDNEKVSYQFDVFVNSELLAKLFDFRKELIEEASKLVTFFDDFIRAQKCEISGLRKAGESVPDISHKLLLNANKCFSNKHHILSWKVGRKVQSSRWLLLIKKDGGFRLQEKMYDLVIYKKNYCKYWKDTILKVESAASYIRFLWKKNEEMIDLLSNTPYRKYLDLAIKEPDEQTIEEHLAEIDEEYRWLESLEVKREERNRRRREKCKMKAAERVKKHEAVSA